MWREDAGLVDGAAVDLLGCGEHGREAREVPDLQLILEQPQVLQEALGDDRVAVALGRSTQPQEVPHAHVGRHLADDVRRRVGEVGPRRAVAAQVQTASCTPSRRGCSSCCCWCTRGRHGRRRIAIAVFARRPLAPRPTHVLLPHPTTSLLVLLAGTLPVGRGVRGRPQPTLARVTIVVVALPLPLPLALLVLPRLLLGLLALAPGCPGDLLAGMVVGIPDGGRGPDEALRLPRVERRAHTHVVGGERLPAAAAVEAQRGRDGPHGGADAGQPGVAYHGEPHEPAAGEPRHAVELVRVERGDLVVVLDLVSLCALGGG
mmetsp:Transcript_52275/g.131390  ORF Transcript_52275/g.131390 Transcript_52275/m.131390 type:complete len:318 (-) Transcript_52275:415-1368(-)